MCSVPMSPSINFIKNGVADSAISKSVDVPYREVTGSLQYLVNGTRPDLACAVSILSRFNQDPKLSHWHAAKVVLKYLCGTTDISILYGGNGADTDLVAYSDSDFASCRDSRKSMTGYIVLHDGGPIIWKATKQTRVAESTTEAEFVACSTACKLNSLLNKRCEE